MQYSALLFGSLALIGCSLDHVVLAELDQAGAAGALAGAATSSPIAVGGSANTSVSAGTGGLMMAAIQAAGEAGQLQFASGGAVQNGAARSSAGEAGAFSELRCSCLGGQQGQLCGSDGITYPAECSDAGPCIPPAVACWHACPCLATDAEGVGTTTWFPPDCVAATECRDGVVCMMFTDISPDSPSACSTAN
ncbi:MAG TPA: hypothetical protein VER12_03735 [Polyangiaceae bacterium]|nr:hypothetical protein [Polyangiaceae bacterium]